jgi:hypothetical protein
VALTLPDGSRGWLVWELHLFKSFPTLLTRLSMHAEQGDPLEVGRALLMYLYKQYPDLDTHVENIPADDPHLPAFFETGYVESFRRIEMHRLNHSTSRTL